MPDRVLLRDYRGAIALNNMGVSLLEQRAYRQGLDTLKDSIVLMKRVFHQQSTPLPSTMPMYSTSNVDAKVEQANKRMANPQAAPSVLSIGVVSYDGPSFYHSTIDSVLKVGSASPFAFVPIRIETADFDTQEDQDHEMESAILLYNLGIAHLCVSKLANSPDKPQELALSLFNLSYTIITNMNCKSRLDDDEEHMQQIHENGMYSLAVIVLNNLVQVLTDMGKHSEANEPYRILVRLSTAIYEMENPDLLSRRAPAATAA
jgi:hypothetical protein